MDLLERIEEQMSATGLPLVGITLAAVPCPDTPVILTLHWHGFARERAGGTEGVQAPGYAPVPSTTLQLNERWQRLVAVDCAAMEAAWELGAWDVARAERGGCLRPGASSTEALECLQAFGAFPCGLNGAEVFIREAPDAGELVQFAAERGYLVWQFRPVSGGIWPAAGDATLTPQGRRPPPCPHRPIPPRCDGSHRTVYRFGVPSPSL